MKHLSLLANLFLCATQISHAMEIIPKKNSTPSQATINCLLGIRNHNLDLVKKSIKQDADINYIDEGGYPLIYRACIGKNKQIIKKLLKQKNIDVTLAQTISKETLLHLACQNNQPKIVQLILEKNPNTINMCDVYGNSPLHEASSLQHIQCIKHMLAYDNNVINKQNLQGATPLHLANTPNVCAKTQLKIIKLLIEHKAETTITDTTQATPLLYLFLSLNTKDILTNFMKKNPQITRKFIFTPDTNNNTQFHLYATSPSCNDHESYAYLSFLTSHGLDIQSRNNDGKRAVDLVLEAYNLSNEQQTTKKLNIKELIKLEEQEQLLHVFLRFISTFIQAGPFKALLELQSSENLPLPKELIAHIMSYYYALNIETIIAKKYKGKLKYYNDFIDNKNVIKQQLREKAEPKLLWS